MVVRCECWVLSGRGLCDGLITRPEESYRLWCVLVCDLGTSRMRRLTLIKGCKCRIKKIEGIPADCPQAHPFVLKLTPADSHDREQDRIF
jgi:hypothetical protein